MSLLQAEIIYYKPLVINDTTTNGGRVNLSAPITTNVKNAVWPDVPAAERASGSTKYRKTFIACGAADGSGMVSPKVFVDKHTSGPDRILIGTVGGTAAHTDTQSAIGNVTRWYGEGPLQANISAGASTLTVTVEDAADDIFKNSDTIRITTNSSAEASDGLEEFCVLAASGACSYNGNVATLTLLSPTVTVNAFTVASGTRVSSVLTPATVVASVDTWVETTSAGTYDETTYPAVDTSISAKGVLEQAVTLTFTSATAFTATTNVSGITLGSGTTSSNFTPSNAATSTPYFTIRSAGFGGTWATNNTITFSTRAAMVPIWQKRIIPSSCGTLSGNTATIAIAGESQ